MRWFEYSSNHKWDAFLSYVYAPIYQTAHALGLQKSVYIPPPPESLLRRWEDLTALFVPETRQTYSLKEVISRLPRLQRGMRADGIKMILGSPWYISSDEWVYGETNRDQSSREVRDKARVLNIFFKEGQYVAHELTEH